MLRKFTIYNLQFTIKLILLLFTFYILHFTFYITPAFAQTLPLSGQAPIPTYVSPTSPIYTDLLVHNLFHTFSCLAVGSSVIGKPCLTYQNGIPVLSQVNLQGGALGASTSLIGLLYKHPPVRTIDYLASVGQGFGFVKEAKAQVTGSGAQVLSPILKLWEASRNIAYIFMIIIFVVIGLMVMFRNKINPQTVITAQAALPGLVIGLVMITFSFFLAGLISDMAFVGTNVVGYYFGAVRNDTSQNLVDDIKGRNILSIFTPFTKLVNRGEVDSALSSIWDDLHDPSIQGWNPLDLDPQKVLVILTGFITNQLLSPFVGLAGGWSQIAVGLVSAGSGSLMSVQVASFALSFIAMAILIYAMFRLLLRLISAFLTIIFLTVTAPFQFLAASLPGRQGIATGWILNMLGNILIFPAVMAVFYFVAYLLGPLNSINTNCAKNPSCPFIISQSNPAPNNIVPPVYAQGSSVQQTSKIVGDQGFPLFGGMSLGFIQLLLAFGALVALPKIPDIVVSTVGKAGQAGQLLGQEIGGSVAAGRGYAGQFQQGAGGIGQQVGRLTSETGVQIGVNPNAGKPITDASGAIIGYQPPHISIPTIHEGQVARAKRRIGW